MNKKYLTDCYKENTMFHPFIIDAYRGISKRTYLYVFKPPCEEDSRPCVLVNWAAPQHRDLLGFNALSLTTCGKGNTYKVKYLADLYHTPCASPPLVL